MTVELLERVEPAYRVIPPRACSRGGEAVDLALMAGLDLDSWQRDVLEDALGERSDGKWSALQVCLLVPRQNGKGSILEARELAGLFLFGEALIVHTAHMFGTAQEHFLRIWDLIEGCPQLERQVTKKLANNNGMLIQVGDQRLKFMARKTTQGRGFTGDLVVLDEAMVLNAFALSAMLPTLSARPNPQVWFTSSAPELGEHSDILRQLGSEGRASTNERMAYTEFRAPDDVGILDREAWAAANPGFPHRVREEWIEGVELPTMAPEDFKRERLGIWQSVEANLVIPAASWAGCADKASKLGDPVVFAVDVSDDRAWASIGVAGPSSEGGVHVELVERRAGTEWVTERARGLLKVHGGRLAVATGSPAASLVVELQGADVQVAEIAARDQAAACGRFFDAVTEGRLRHIGQASLDSAVASADRRFAADAWTWSRRGSSGDISPLVAVTLALWAAEKPAGQTFMAWA